MVYSLNSMQIMTMSSGMGLGPAETYADRKHGAKLGIYENMVTDNLARYLVPQECGSKEGVRWAKITDRKGQGNAL